MRVFQWFSVSLWRVFGVYLFTLLLFAGIFSGLEGRGYGESLYYACVTSLTIGYGDIAPVTASGRFIAMVFAHFWVFIIAPLVVASFLKDAMIDPHAFTHEEQEEIRDGLRELREHNRAATFE
jgi:hypothetical protein